ncbi:MAG: PQQ-dependent sugar dehydrogenase [Pseudomonadales bacterium]|nr:PQQ-dependent sugar dehydrogenase [Pseudomonadales bacterium]
MVYWRLIIFCILSFFSLSLCCAPAFDRHYSEDFDDFSIELLLSGFGPSWGLEYLSGHRLLIGEWKSGYLYIADMNTSKVHRLGQVKELYSAGQAGLLDIMADRHFSQNGRIYFTRSFLQGNKSTTQLLTAVIRTVAKEDRKASGFSFWRKEGSPFVMTDMQVLFSAAPWVNSRIHYGGALAQDEAGLIYMTVGDRGQRKEAQKPGSQLGKIMQINIEAQTGTKKGLRLKSAGIYSLGHRNAQGLIYTPGSRRLWAAEHGPKGGDEVNLIKAGANYGWPLVTQGEEYFGGKIAVAEQLEGMQDAMITFTPSLAVSALVHYPDTDPGPLFIADLAQNFLLLSLKAKEIHMLVEEHGELVSRGLLMEHIHERWRNAVVADSGEVFLLAESGKVYRLYKRAAD